MTSPLNPAGNEAYKKASKKVCVLWSGGADSTWVIEHFLRDPEYQWVYAAYVHLRNNDAKSRSELAAIERMLPVLQRDPRFEYLGIVVQVNYARANRNLAFKQVPIWVHALVEAIPFAVEEVALGYCKGDEATGQRAAIEALYVAHQPFMHRALPALVFPAAEVSKSEILDWLAPELRDAVVYCESPVVTPIGPMGKDEPGAMEEVNESEVSGTERFVACGRCRICMSRAERLRGL